MDFVAIDVETANADLASICQIGLARFQNGALVEEWKSLVQPSDYFDPINVSIHGIDESMVQGAPLFPDLSPVLGGFLNGRVAVSHTHFDRSALRKSFEKRPRSWLFARRREALTIPTTLGSVIGRGNHFSSRTLLRNGRLCRPVGRSCRRRHHHPGGHPCGASEDGC
jgi:hypothetical protein